MGNGQFDSVPGDKDCHLAPACLSCHLLICVLDDPKVEKQERNLEILQLREAGIKASEVANRFRLSTRRVQGILRDRPNEGRYWNPGR